ncbi:hypothetical protein QOZ80_7BG0610690 [Eleusine coracana subsp. coracana]|nr:hypothetical protein QOZ80_7BG0610690 [Eleusine coracana subsp. coracana]
MDSSCDAAAVPFTLIGALLTAGPAAWPACVGGGRAFLRDYAQRGTNALLWAGLLATTWVLLLRLVALLRLWALGSRIPGPHAFLADPGLAAVLRAGGDITGFLSKLHDNYGPAVRLWLGPSQLLVSVKDPTLIKEVLTKAEDKLPLTGRTYTLACGRLDLFVSSFEKVKSRRESLKAFLNEKLTVGGGQAYEELLMMVAKDGCFWASYAVPPFWKPGYRRSQGRCFKWHDVSNILTRVVLSPKLQDQLYADIVAICNESSELNIDDVLRMQYLLATVCESARLLPAGPLLQRCSLEHDLTLESGITVPAGAVLVVPLHLVQMDNSMWGSDAGQFNPQRFLEKDVDIGEILAAPNGSNGINLSTECAKTESFLPFGSGSRACVGQKFVILAISMLIASLLRNYEVKPHPHVSKEMDQTIRSNNLHHLPNLKITLIKREI